MKDIEQFDEYFDLNPGPDWDDVGNYGRIDEILYPTTITIFNTAKSSAAARKIPFRLNAYDFDHWWTYTPDKCHYCEMTWGEYLEARDYILVYKGDDPRITRYKKFLLGYHANKGRLTLDRKNSLDGYAPENIVKCCWFCNSAKGHFFEEDDITLVMKKANKNLLKAIAYHKHIAIYGEPERCDV